MFATTQDRVHAVNAAMLDAFGFEKRTSLPDEDHFMEWYTSPELSFATVDVEPVLPDDIGTEVPPRRLADRIVGHVIHQAYYRLHPDIFEY